MRSKDVPRRWWLKSQLHDDSFATDFFQRGTSNSGPGKQPADVWFDNDDADHYEIVEEYITGYNESILVLLTLAGEDMLNAGFDRDLWTGKARRGWKAAADLRTLCFLSAWTITSARTIQSGSLRRCSASGPSRPLDSSWPPAAACQACPCHCGRFCRNLPDGL